MTFIKLQSGRDNWIRINLDKVMRYSAAGAMGDGSILRMADGDFFRVVESPDEIDKAIEAHLRKRRIPDDQKYSNIGAAGV